MLVIRNVILFFYSTFILLMHSRFCSLLIQGWWNRCWHHRMEQKIELFLFLLAAGRAAQRKIIWFINWHNLVQNNNKTLYVWHHPREKRSKEELRTLHPRSAATLWPRWDEQPFFSLTLLAQRSHSPAANRKQRGSVTEINNRLTSQAFCLPQQAAMYDSSRSNTIMLNI